MVDFPEPDGPTIAVVEPAFIEKLAFSRTGLCSSEAVGYLKVMFSNLISSFKWIKPRRTLSLFRISGTRSITLKMSAPRVYAAIKLCTLGRAAIKPINPVINAIRTESTSYWAYGSSVFVLIV